MAKNQYTRRVGIKVGRNDLCPCGSGKKYKNCCIDVDKVTAEDILNDEDDVTLSDLANPSCKRCYGKGFTGFVHVSDDEKIPALCDARGCAMEKYLERKLERRREEARKRKAEGKKSEKVEKSEEVPEEDSSEE